MEFDNSFEVPLPPEQAWPVLMNIQGIAPCMPGAKLTDVVDDKTYKGNIAVRLGPGGADLRGHGDLRGDRQRQPHRARQGPGQRRQGPRLGARPPRRSGWSLPRPAPRSWCTPTSRLSGAVAQYGRGVGMIQATASALMNQFANNLKKQLADPQRRRQRAAKPISAASLAGQVAWNAIKDKLGGKS